MVHLVGLPRGEVSGARATSFLLRGGRFEEKFAEPCPSTRAGSYALRVEDLSKTESRIGRLSLVKVGP